MNDPSKLLDSAATIRLKPVVSPQDVVEHLETTHQVLSDHDKRLAIATLQYVGRHTTGRKYPQYSDHQSALFDLYDTGRGQWIKHYGLVIGGRIVDLGELPLPLP